MRIVALHLLTPDLAAQRRFYAERLGLPILAEDEAGLMLGAGSSTLTFAPAPPGWRGAYHFAFTIPENRLAEARAWLVERAPLIPGADGADEFHSANWNSDAVYFADPAGNILELIARHELPNAAAGPFTAAGLLSVSEIGLVVDDVPAAVAGLGASLGVEPYRQSVDPTFTAVGDAHGLLIVVRRGRPWFPDSLAIPADPLPLTLELIDAAGRPRRLAGPPYTVAD